MSVKDVPRSISASQLAARDAGLSHGALTNVDFLALADCYTWAYECPVDRLAGRLGAAPNRTVYSEPSGTAGHSMLEAAMTAIRDGQCDFALLCGGESMATLGHLARQGQTPDRSFPAPPDGRKRVDLTQMQHRGEMATGLMEGAGAVYTFAMRDIARRAHLGVSNDEYRHRIGGCSPK